MHEKPTQNHPEGTTQVEQESSGRKQRVRGLCQVAASFVLSKCLRTAATRLLEVLLRFTLLPPHAFLPTHLGPRFLFVLYPLGTFLAYPLTAAGQTEAFFSPSLPISHSH